ncbi:hypothetical protein [Nostoc sp. FACHB-110]|uniref:hypothetical protein n=1 Tax=Nostoc sp. FACHB-110 TaxID=2692834 RepID=UPI001687BDA7|nr:hypothetical protein [Nostoc sp. FACHB-110]MBD2441462.1 hypothetical protein [Nostoc sp. FACHB-110]
MTNKLYIVAIAAINKHSQHCELTVCTAEVELDKEEKLNDKVTQLASTLYPLNKYYERQIQTQIVDRETLKRCI